MDQWVHPHGRAGHWAYPLPREMTPLTPTVPHPGNYLWDYRSDMPEDIGPGSLQQGQRQDYQLPNTYGRVQNHPFENRPQDWQTNRTSLPFVQGMSGEQKRLHICSGHFKVRKTGIYWWRPHWRGHEELGIVERRGHKITA